MSGEISQLIKSSHEDKLSWENWPQGPNLCLIPVTGLCSWVINIYAFHLVWMVVLPKRKALAQANQDLAAARAKLAELKAKLQVT